MSEPDSRRGLVTRVSNVAIPNQGPVHEPTEFCQTCGCPVVRGGVPRLGMWWVAHDCDVSNTEHWHQHAPVVDDGFFERVSERTRQSITTSGTATNGVQL